MEVKQYKMYIGGRWVDADSGKTFQIKNPATGETVGIVPDAGAAETRKAVEAAQQAFKGWAATPPKARGELLRKVYNLMRERVDVLARLVTLENGKPFEEAKKEVAFAAGYFDWFAEEARRAYGEIVPSPAVGKRLWVIRQPIGVVGAITPWNFPATMLTRKIAPALAAGCTVVSKPASATPLTALAIAEIVHEAGLPAGVLNVVTGSKSKPIGDELVQNPLVRKIAFTGSTAVGKALMEGASQQLKRVSFELGGNAPFIVFDDADLDEAVEGAVAIKYLRVAGQSCICANRLYVQDTIADKFTKAFVEKVKAIKVGSGFEPGAQVGPLINEETLEKVNAIVQDAVSRGAQVMAGGRRLSDGAFAGGYFYPPTVLVNVNEEMAVCRDEIFGPVAPVLRFKTEEELIQRANDTTFGLASYFYSRDLARIVRVAEGLEYGLVGVNDSAGYTHEIPFGGYKESGLGREGGKLGLEEYTEVKSIVVNLPR